MKFPCGVRKALSLRAILEGQTNPLFSSLLGLHTSDLTDGTVLLYRHRNQFLASTAASDFLTTLHKSRVINETPTDSVTFPGFTMSHLTSLSLAIAPLLWWLHISEVMCRMPYQHGHGYMVGDDGKLPQPTPDKFSLLYAKNLCSFALLVTQTQGSDTTNVHWQCTMVINCICEVIWGCGA